MWTVDTKTGKTLKVYDEGGGGNRYPDISSKGVAWSPNGKFLAAIGSSGRVCVWDVSTGENIAEEISVEEKILVVAWAPTADASSQRLAFAGTGNEIRVLDTQTTNVVQSITQYGWTRALDWSPDGEQIAATDRRSINIWKISSGVQELVGKLEGPSSMLTDLSWSSTEGRIAALTEDGKVCLWNAETAAYTAEFELHERVPYSIHWSPNGTRLVSTARHGRIVFQDIDQTAAE